LQQIGQSEVIVNSWKFRIDCCGAFELVYRFGQKAGLAIRPAKYDPKLRTVAELREHPIINLFCRREFATLEVGEPERVFDFVVVWREAIRGLQIGDHPLKVSEQHAHLSYHL